MRSIRRPIVRTGSLLLLIALAISVIAGCGNSTVYVTVTPTPKTPLKTPNDPKPVTVVAGQATTLDLGGGADLIIPPGAVKAGATVSATYKGRPDGNWTNIAPTFAPVELISNPPDAIHGLLTLEFPVPVDQITSGVDPALQFGISTYDPATKTWTPFASTYDSARHMIVALIPHFSWWNPFSWDWGALARAVQQGFGQLWGERAAPPKCSSGPLPSWVSTVNFLSMQDDAQVRACAQTSSNSPDLLEIRMVNNRAYGQVLTYGSGVQWGWHDSGKAEDLARNTLMDLLMGHNQLYLPPLSSATVGILKPKPGADVTFTIWPTWQTIGADMAFYVLGQLQDKAIEKGFDKVIKAGEGACYGIGAENALTGLSMSSIRDNFSRIASCVEEAFSFDVAAGILSNQDVGQIESWYGTIKNAKVLATGLQVADAIWKLGDLISDAILRTMPRGNGFEVQAVGSNPPRPPTVTPPPPHPNPTPPPPPTVTPPPPQHTYAETAGPGGGNTFTNPANAGAPLGQHVAAYQTIQVSCRLTGWKAQDGNTWWYKIASGPWNNAFYAPADNYYNNGATSGSLIGTPFVDTAVPMC